MNNDPFFEIIEYRREYAQSSVEMWRASKYRALGVVEAHSIEQHLYFLNEILIKDHRVYLALKRDSDQVIGLMATDGRTINQLYIHIDCQGMGIGSALLQLAKEKSAGKLRLRTFEINRPARQFYEKHGFRIIGQGNDNEENLPDLLYQWAGDSVDP